MTDAFLQIRIEEAKAAAAELEAQERLKAKAAELQPLLEEQARLEKVGQATVALENTLDSLAARLESLNQAAGAFQARFTALQVEAKSLQAEYSRLSREHASIRGETVRAYSAYQRDTAVQRWTAGRPEWTAQQHNGAERLAAQVKQLSIFPAGISPYDTSQGYDRLAAAVAGQLREPVSLRTR